MSKSAGNEDGLVVDGTTVSQIWANDVLLGRGAGPNEHKGNIAYRATVAEFKKSYMKTTNRKIKNTIAHRVIRAIKASNGRFLQRAKGTEELYELADDAVILEKTKQALRHVDRTKRRNVDAIYLPSFPTTQPQGSCFSADRLKHPDLLQANDALRVLKDAHDSESFLQLLTTQLQDVIQFHLAPPAIVSGVPTLPSLSLSETSNAQSFGAPGDIQTRDQTIDTLASLLALGHTMKLRPTLEDELWRIAKNSVILPPHQSTTWGRSPCAGPSLLQMSSILGFNQAQH